MVERTNEVESETEVSEEIKEQKVIEPKIALTSIRRILKEQGIERIEKSALEEIRFILEDIIRDMSRNIIVYMRHAKRKTAQKADVLLAIR